MLHCSCNLAANTSLPEPSWLDACIELLAPAAATGAVSVEADFVIGDLQQHLDHTVSSLVSGSIYHDGVGGEESCHTCGVQENLVTVGTQRGRGLWEVGVVVALRAQGTTERKAILRVVAHLSESLQRFGNGHMAIASEAAADCSRVTSSNIFQANAVQGSSRRLLEHEVVGLVAVLDRRIEN